MKHTRSSAEVEIREAVVARFRQIWPDARIIHEMNVAYGRNRADVVAVTPKKLIITEIKSERDKLDRLFEQARTFRSACHMMVVAAHEKWFVQPPMVEFAPGSFRQPPSPIVEALRGEYAVMWRYPEPQRPVRDWTAYDYQEQHPWPVRMLWLLWVEELKDICERRRIAFSGRPSSTALIEGILHHLRGWEIEQEVCRELRRRTFAEADDAIDDDAVGTGAPARLDERTVSGPIGQSDGGSA